MHLFVADGAGAEAILDLATHAPADLFSRGHIVYIPLGVEDARREERLRGLDPNSMFSGPSLTTALPRLQQVLAMARMGSASTSPARRL